MNHYTLFFLKLTSLLLLGAPLAAVALPPALPTLYTVAELDAKLRVIDPLTAATVSSVTMTLTGKTIEGASGLATQPVSNTLYALLKLTGQSGKELITVNPTTGIVTDIGDTGDDFAGLAFKSDGTLYGVSDDNALTPETLFTINTSDATVTPVLELGAGDDGEAIAFDSADGLLYHASGKDTACSTSSGVCFESVDTVTLATPTDIDISSTALTDSQAQALTYWQAQGVFLWKQGFSSGPLYRVTNVGAVSLVGSMDHLAKGLAFVPPPPVQASLESGLLFSMALLMIGIAGLYKRGRSSAKDKRLPW